ncbi:ABC1 kinase family protein [Cohnella terricola]|uniref:AarF/ABC1/UbiB kinase family protein n=1 Tax=Cohnella terricola TaxID=1289167 RepID=A0A559JQ40_9BACL|nr:AarF/ABC1/UbiB kinase family protein [Cohnella terricola]TVY01992.1 AarF/ABC1/UbiB kinase family protein [Cohnella terricola]
MNAKKRLRQLRRYRSIAAAFARNGFGYVSRDMGLTDKLPFYRGEEREGKQAGSIGKRIRLLLEELGPTFVKLGQIAGTRRDLLPEDIVAELERLQDEVAEFPYEQAAKIIEEELGASLGELFLRFAETPVAAASIGQVYRAALKDGTEVAVKVQRPNVRAVIETDLDILEEWANLAESRLEWARNYRLRDIVDELGKALRAELDYGTEARNAERFAVQCRELNSVRVPGVYWDYSTKRVLTMDYIEGIKLSDHARLDRAGLNRRKIAEKFAETILHQVLVEGFFHGDPHPGNVLAQPDSGIALLDFGMAGRLSPEMKKHFASFVIALRKQSTRGVLRAISNMGVVPKDADMGLLYADVEDMREKYYRMPLARVSIGEAVHDLFAVAFRHRIRIPTELTLLGKTLLTTEAVVTALDPTFSIMDVAEPVGRKLFFDRLDPRETLKNWSDELPEYFDLFNDVTIGLKQLAQMLRQGKLRVETVAPQADAAMKRLDRISNRLSFSIVLLSLSIVMLGLIIGAAISHAKSPLWRIPVIEIGLGVSLLMFLWLLHSIFRSGRF